LEFTKKVLALGECRRVEKMCRHMIKRLSFSPEEADAVNEFRSLLISAMMEIDAGENASNAILEELDRLFTGYLTLRDRTSAARTLVRKTDYLDGRDWQEAFETAYKTIELFAGSHEEDVVGVAREAYRFLYRELPKDDPRFGELCVFYGKFLEQAQFDPEESCSAILEIDESLDGGQNAAAVEIIESFLAVRSGDISDDSCERLHSRLAANHLYLNAFESAIEECTWLLIKGEGQSQLDYVLWCGEAFMGLDREQTAAMFFREVVRATSEDSEDERGFKARQFLDEIESSAMEQDSK
jgi:hypothetical protein